MLAEKLFVAAVLLPLLLLLFWPVIPDREERQPWKRERWWLD